MVMVASVEARWFLQGSATPEALNWIQKSNRQPTKAEERQDHYVDLSGEVLGVKLRDGKLEVKRRDFELGLAPLGSRATGRLALWRKWSFKVGENSANKAPDDFWTTVEKERYLCKYSMDGGGLKDVDPSCFPTSGCTVELTQIKVSATRWWSVGFEAFGTDENRLRDTLVQVATHSFAQDDYPTLQAEDSFDYPEWLASLSESGARRG